MLTSRGGNGVGIFYLQDRNDEDIGGGIFGMTKRFNGFAIFINNVLTNGDNNGYIQGFYNENGEDFINPTELPLLKLKKLLLKICLTGIGSIKWPVL